MDDFTTPEEATQAIHQVLRHLNAPTNLHHKPWLSSALVGRALRQAPALLPHQALKQVFTDTLSALAEESPQLADLLRGRYWEGLTVAEMLRAGRPLQQEERSFYLQQRQAVDLYAALLLGREEACRREEPVHLLQRLPLATYRRLYGVEGYVDRLLAWLHDRQQHAIITIKGIGGIGKTALADYTVRRYLKHNPLLHDLIWLSAKQEYLTPSGITGARAQIRVEHLFDDLGSKLGLPDVLRLPLAQKIDRLAPLLRSRPYLVIIDNLESVDDFQQLAPWLARLAEPTKFLITSRELLPALETVTAVELGELDQEASHALIEATALDKGISDIDPEAVYALVGGHPLAILLTISQMQVLPPDQVLHGLASGTTATIYTYIYWKSWTVLDDDAREVLFAIQRAGDQVDWTWLETVLDLTPQRLQSSLQQLLDLSLVQPQRGEHGTRLYTIHRLTSTFLRAEVLGWQ